MAHTLATCDRPWWKRPPVWFVGIALVVVLLVVVTVETPGNSNLLPYSVFLDQLEAGNVASVVFQGTEINGRLKQPSANASSSGTAQSDSFSSRTPDIGDPSLISELRRQHVMIDVHAPSAWASLLERVPWPILFVIGVALIAGLVRLVRGGKTAAGSVRSMHPMHGMVQLISGLFGKPQQSASPPSNASDGQMAHRGNASGRRDTGA